MLQNLSVILVRPRFPENIGMAARAMANMGASGLILVNPERWEPEKALPLATHQGEALLASVAVLDDLGRALAPFAASFGATARTGGWRCEVLTPERAATAARAEARGGGRVALVFGSEDSGLTNAEVELCTHLVTIPTSTASSSLNLAQAVLLLLYECARADRELSFTPGGPAAEAGEVGRGWTRPAKGADSRRATLEEEALLLAALQNTLTRMGHLPEDNPAWAMRSLRRFLHKSRLRRHEFDMFMGICRKIDRLI